MFSISARPSTFINSDDITLNKLEMVITPLGSLQLIETTSVDDITAGIGRNIYFPPNTSKPTLYFVFFLVVCCSYSFILNVFQTLNY